MERLKKRYQLFIKAFSTLEKSITTIQAVTPQDQYYEQFRDSLIQRFEYSIDTFWKLLKQYLEVKHALTPPASPKGVFRAALDAHVITQNEFDILVDMIEDRNLTSHAYNIELAEKISSAIPVYYRMLQTICSRLKIN